MARDQIFLNDALYDYMLAVSDREPAILARLREETRPMKLGFWQIPANQGQFLAVLVKCCGARQILEIGTFTGYSSLAMARALPANGRMVCCDISEERRGVPLRSTWFLSTRTRTTTRPITRRRSCSCARAV
jgi:predicted O-methyltransferase YrrM